VDAARRDEFIADDDRVIRPGIGECPASSVASWRALVVLLLLLRALCVKGEGGL
jgi:hypothetical protein